MTRALIISDTHLEAGVELHPSYLAVKRFAKYWRPDAIFHLGDIGHWDFISSFNRELLGKIEGKTWTAEYDVIRRELDDLQKITRNVTLLLGNHDERVYTALDRQPSLRGLADFESQLQLKERGIVMLRDTEQPYRFGKLAMVHGWFCNKYHAAKHLDTFGGNIVYGHVHRFQTASHVLASSRQEVQAWSIACLCDHAPEYMNGRPSGWQHGFAVVYLMKDGNFNLYPVNIVQDRFAFEGRIYDAEGLLSERKIA